MSKAYPLLSTQGQLKKAIKASNNKIRRNLKPKEWEAFNEIKRKTSSGHSTFKKYSKRGVLKPQREKLHSRIIKKTFKDKRTIDKKDPDIYILGGVAASGKSFALRARIPERAVVIDSDNFKEQLIVRDKSPVSRFKLAHASQLHEEATVLVNKSIKKAREESRDVILDTTLSQKDKANKIVKKYKEAGYDVHLLGTQLHPHRAIKRATQRFLDKPPTGNGRYVQGEIIASKGNLINRNVMDFRKKADWHEIIDTTTLKNMKTISKSKDNITKNYRNP